MRALNGNSHKRWGNQPHEGESPAMREHVHRGVASIGWQKAPRGAVTYLFRDRDYGRSAEGITQVAISRMLATIKGYDFAGEYDSLRHYPGHLYVVPSDTLVGVEAAHALEVHSEDDLFGGVVPHAFVATKAITHPLVDAAASGPVGWSHCFAQRVSHVVLPGFTAFTRGDALRAGARMLELGPIRIKPARNRGGRGQTKAADLPRLEAALDAIDPLEIVHDGLVLEQDLANVTTYSVGQARVGGLVATYAGTQHGTTDGCGAIVYGGSDLLIVRGSYDALLGLDLTPEERLAIAQARAYDTAASQEFPGLLASRRNYDVARGRDAQGCWRTGVLEQSWRIGGASGPEIAAIAAFRVAPELQAIRASSVKTYATKVDPPPHAILYVRIVDDRGVPITKYTVVEPYVGWLLARSGIPSESAESVKSDRDSRKAAELSKGARCPSR